MLLSFFFVHLFEMLVIKKKKEACDSPVSDAFSHTFDREAAGPLVCRRSAGAPSVFQQSFDAEKHKTEGTVAPQRLEFFSSDLIRFVFG